MIRFLFDFLNFWHSTTLDDCESFLHLLDQGVVFLERGQGLAYENNVQEWEETYCIVNAVLLKAKSVGRKTILEFGFQET